MKRSYCPFFHFRESSMARNTIEIRVAGLQRSGNHAIIDWMIEQHRGKRICFLNNVVHGAEDPFQTAEQIETYGFESTSDLSQQRKDVLVVSYEDQDGKMRGDCGFLDSAFSDAYEQEHDALVGESGRRIDMLIMRDPYNFFASRLKKLHTLSGTKDVDWLLATWKQLARFAQSEAGVLGQGSNNACVFVNFNAWFSSRQYRRQLCAHIEGHFSDASLKRLPHYGGGSSFDGHSMRPLSLTTVMSEWPKLLSLQTYLDANRYLRRFRGARGMDVNQRWRSMRDDPEFKRIIKDPELAELSMLFREGSHALPLQPQ